ncbi:MAG TPA: FAD-binding oxidoreductase [Kofleriaceae bacterium]|nr:FAD-binding oxidoreductase [Kofleriaceae bacterium]
MSTSRSPFVDGRFLKQFVIACCLVPGALLLWDAYQGQLGVNEVNFAIRTTGLVGLVFLTLSLAITPLRRLTKWNVLISARRNFGVFGFFYILTHFVIFWLFDRAGSIGSTLHEIVARPYLWFGFGALLLMTPLAITSFDGMVTRLGAKRWKRLHRLAYAAGIFGVVHYYMLVKADTTQPLAFAVVLGGLLASRFIPTKKPLPKKRMFWSGELELARIVDETHDVKTFRFVNPAGGPLPFEHVAGQYLNLKLTIDGKRVNRSYTIASPPTRRDYCEISVKKVPNGYGSKHLHETWREGELIKIAAPAGKFYFAGHEAKRIVMIAGGIGITPMMAVARSLTDRGWTGDIYLVFSIRLVKDIVFRDELAQLVAAHKNLHVCYTVSGDPDTAWDGPRGNITRELLETVVPDLTRGPIMLCGPDAMMTAMRKLLVGMGIPDAEIHQEAFVSPPTPNAGDPEPIDDVPDGIRNLTFERAGKRVQLTNGLTVLEAAEECGVDIPFECRSGICGQCKTRLISGHVAMEVQDALTPNDKMKGLILACQAVCTKDAVIDA